MGCCLSIFERVAPRAGAGLSDGGRQDSDGREATSHEQAPDRLRGSVEPAKAAFGVTSRSRINVRMPQMNSESPRETSTTVAFAKLS